MRVIFLIISGLTLFPVFSGFCEEPWSVLPERPVFKSPPPPSIRADWSESTSGIACRTWLAFYQNWLGVVSRSHCRMEPSCSNFAIQAIQRHGAAIGVMMTGDRLLHEADEQKARRIVSSWGIAYCPDPVSNNDFWWYKQ